MRKSSSFTLRLFFGILFLSLSGIAKAQDSSPVVFPFFGLDFGIHPTSVMVGENVEVGFEFKFGPLPGYEAQIFDIDYSVNWGDGTISHDRRSQSTPTFLFISDHSFSSAGAYHVSVFGLVTVVYSDLMQGVAGLREFQSVANPGGVVTVAAPVPEPETYAMLLAGLGLLGFAVRRRKQKESAAA